jgi:hypothetical protein
LDKCDHSGDTDDDIPEDHECRYDIRPGTLIQEIHPETRVVEKSYHLEGPQEILSSNVITDFKCNGGKLTVCPLCRTVPDIEWIDDGFIDVFVELAVEEVDEKVIKMLYKLFPTLHLLLPLSERKGALSCPWLFKVRGYVVKEMRKRISSLSLVTHQGVAEEAERRLFWAIRKDVDPD